MLDSQYVEAIRKDVAAAATTQAKTEALKGRAKGDTCVILACGPSLNEYSQEELAKLCEGTVVFAVKQAFQYVPTVCDFLLLNTWNYQKYDFAERRPLILYEKGPTDPAVFGEHDVVFDLPEPSDLSTQLARSKKFDDYTFDASPLRPWGPGVLYEIGFYLAEYMGFKNIITLGWDVGAKSTSVMPHFYDRPSAHRTRTLARSRDIRSIVERNRYLHDGGVLYNKPRIIPEEVDICAAVSGDWYDWLKSKGINLQVCSRGAMVDPKIPRVRLEDVLAVEA